VKPIPTLPWITAGPYSFCVTPTRKGRLRFLVLGPLPSPGSIKPTVAAGDVLRESPPRVVTDYGVLPEGLAPLILRECIDRELWDWLLAEDGRR
jgi:hypothetical protein